MKRFDGKVAVVAGGGGIGGATARRLGAEGARVVIGDLLPDEAGAIADNIVAAGGESLGLGLDIADPVSVEALFAAADAHFGGIDAVHVNAADLQVIFEDSDAATVSLEVFDRTIAVGLRGHLICTQAAIPRLLARGGGAIVYTASVAAFAGEPERPCYGMAKAGVTALMRHVSSRWGKEGIRANAVAPGLVLTPNNRKTMPEEFAKLALRSTRSTRLGEPEDIAAMVCTLLGPDGAWVNGQVISVDGGSMLR